MPKDPNVKKRKKKLAEKKRQARQAAPLAYEGTKYKTERLVPVWMNTETAIYEVYVATRRRLFDHNVASALERLIRAMRTGTLPPLPETVEMIYEIGKEEDLLIENIRRIWDRKLPAGARPSQDDLIGVLRTILGSVERMRAPGLRSQYYLQHVVKFVTKHLGISVAMMPADDREPPPESAGGEVV